MPHRLRLIAASVAGIAATAFLLLAAPTHAAERSFSGKASDGATATFTLNDSTTAATTVQIGNSAAVGCMDRAPFTRSGTLPLAGGQFGGPGLSGRVMGGGGERALIIPAGVPHGFKDINGFRAFLIRFDTK